MPSEFVEGPYLAAALLCERTIQESDGVLTLVRVIDKVTATPIAGITPPEPARQPFLVSLSLAVLLKSGGVTGNYVVKVLPHEPDGTALQASEVPVSFAGSDPAQGANVLINMNLGVRHEGLYWFDVLLDDQMISRVPLRIEYLPAEDQLPPALRAPETGE